MFNLVETISQYNQTHQANIKSNKTWGLAYLQPEGLAVLNDCKQLTEKYVYHASHFVTDRKGLRKALAETRHQSTHQSLSVLKDIVRRLKIDQSILDRFNWEELLARSFSQDSLEQRFNEAKVENDAATQQMIVQAYKQWKIHEPFQYYSSQGLLFLLEVITQYQDRFSEAQKELMAKQKAWIRPMRLPPSIAESYEHFLLTESNKLVVLREQVIEALLLRLKAIEAQGQVICDDVSYTFAKCIPSLGLPDIPLPNYQLKLENTTFHQIQHAIEKHGNVNQKKWLYQLERYQLKEYSFITLASHRLLIPKPIKKWVGLFFNHHRLQFLEVQQALLAQLSFSMVFDVESPDALTLSDPALQIVITRHELLQQSLQLLIKQQPYHWWQWQQKCWHKAWKAWLIEQIHNNQGCLSDCLAAFSQHIQSHKKQLNETTYCEKVQATIQFIQTLIGNDPSEHQDILLTSTLEHLSILLQERKVKKNNIPIFYASDTLLQSFKDDVSTVLRDYTQYYHDQGTSTPRKSFPDVIALWGLILNSNDNDIVKFGEELTQRYRAMQPVLFKWMPALDFNVLRRNLKTVLDNPKYSMEQLKLAAQSQAEQAIYQETDELSESYSDSDSLSSHSSWEEVEPLSTQAQPLINNPEHSPYFFKNSFKFTEQPSSTLTVRATA
ncbi:hypothetical protein [Rickettsiella endosymbiont of Dermanyssus gallinae]|uniref:hypothetical protein n=1 Tax=Rickettsiella endosymbiont of Dermanyssus gallinae TaxID=2856608 RepID=UPI001C52B549|nr:hypothetical protein [Rickettsiella endosymbiont of Dermanyssus gallinae]